MKKLLRSILFGSPYDGIVEGMTAEQYTNPVLRQKIQDKYRDLYHKPATPFTHPDQFDPLNPPLGWAWDPYYEFWIKLQ